MWADCEGCWRPCTLRGNVGFFEVIRTGGVLEAILRRMFPIMRLDAAGGGLP